jgi:hypothetical protein
LPYVITEPDSIKGVYETWDECRSKVKGVKGAKHQKVQDEAEAQALLNGTGVVLKPGLHVFTDGNHLGGVGVVIVWMSKNPSDEPTVVAEIATSVRRIFYGGVVPALGSEEEVELALKKIRHVLAELGGLYLALWQAPASSAITIVHDYEGVGSWMTDKWKRNEPVVRAIVDSCKQIVEDKRLDLRFQWQRGHTSSWAGRHDPARFNARADALATAGGSSSGAS